MYRLTNTCYFIMYYNCVCRLTSPILLLAIALCLAACYFIMSQNQDKKIAVIGKFLCVMLN